MIKSCKKPPVYFESTTGSFYSQYAGLPLKSCRVDLPVNQSGSGTPSPTNIRDFIPYTSLDFTANSTVKTFNFGQTVYAGTLDVLSGVLAVTHGVTVYDGSNDENWAVQSIAGFWIDNTAKKVGRGNYLADNYQATDLSGWDISTPNGYFSGHPTLQRFYFRTPYDSFEVTLDNWRSWLSSNPITVVYELATPITIPLGGEAINTILGLNSLISSVGNISAEYLKAGR